MPIVISEEEKTSIEDYFNHPEHYISDEVLASLGGRLPNGSKVSRAKRSYEDGYVQPRYYIIPSGMDVEARYIPIITPVLNDPGTHSATMLNDKIYFHQNEDDLPKKLPDNFEIFCEIDEDDDPDDPSIIAFREAWERIKGQPDYVLNVKSLGLFKNTVKYAIDMEDNVFYLKSRSSFVEGGVAVPNRAEQYAPQLYMGPSIFRRTVFFGHAQTKRIDITRASGENLREFMLTHQDELTPVEIELLARDILKQYLVQIYDKGLTHTDIKSANICVKMSRIEGLRFEIVFIDWDEAFRSGAGSAMGNGTPGYMAPEFFKTPQDCERQFENRGISIKAYCDTLKSDYKNLFSQSSDIYALGIVLMNDLQLKSSSPLYHLAHAMRHDTPRMRPSGEHIHDVLEPNAHIQSIYSEALEPSSYIQSTNKG